MSRGLVMGRRSVLVAALSLAVVAAAALSPAPTLAGGSARQRVTPVFPGVERHEWALTTPDGAPVAAQALVVTDHDAVKVRPVLGQGVVPGLETVPDMGRRVLGSGGVAGINGGFWLHAPVGEPNGYVATGSELVSEAETQGSSPRGTLGALADGRGIVDRVYSEVSLVSDGGGGTVLVNGVNRLDRGAPFPDGPDAVYVFTPAYGPRVSLPGPDSSGYRGRATVVALPGADLPASGAGRTVVAPLARGVDGGAVDVPTGGLLAVGYGSGGTRLRETVSERLVHAATVVGTVDRARHDLWSGVVEALAAGPLIVRDGRMTPPQGWEQEGFSPALHSNVRAPRSAAGVTADGRILLATVDGRQPGYSAGMTMAELAGFMLRLGAHEAISLDGGGSTQMVVDGIVRNRPSDGRPRPVATGLFLFHDYDFDASERLAGRERQATAAAVARAAFPDGADEVVLAAAHDFPDALAGGPLAASLGAPMLLTGRDAMAPATTQAVVALGARRATVLGGSAAVSEAVAAELRSAGLSVRRIAGRERFETAGAIAAAMGASHQRVFVASGTSFADALSAAAPAGMLRAPILLTMADHLPAASRQAVRRASPSQALIVGGVAAVGDRVATELRAETTTVARLAGSTRYGTARAVNEWADGEIGDLDRSGLVVARGDLFPDALAGGPLAARRRHLLMIVPPTDVHAQPDASEYLRAAGDGPLERVTLLGGHGVLSSHQQRQLNDLAR